MPKYKIPIIETLRRDVIIEAEDRDEAYEILSEKYYSGEGIILDARDFYDSNFGEAEEIEDE